MTDVINFFTTSGFVRLRRDKTAWQAERNTALRISVLQRAPRCGAPELFRPNGRLEAGVPHRKRAVLCFLFQKRIDGKIIRVKMMEEKADRKEKNYFETNHFAPMFALNPRQRTIARGGKPRPTGM